MRTKIDIEVDVLAAAKELARLQSVSAGLVVSKLLRNALAGGGQPKQQNETRQIGGAGHFWHAARWSAMSKLTNCAMRKAFDACVAGC